MADSPAEKKKTDSTYWRNVAFVEARAREVARRRSDLWQALAKFIHTNGASVVSLPNAPRMRIEMRQDSNLVNKLKEAGFSPTHCGVSTRIVPDVVETFEDGPGRPVVRHHSGIIDVDIIEIILTK